MTCDTQLKQVHGRYMAQTLDRRFGFNIAVSY